MNRGIHADFIVYIFAHLHTTLRTEGDMLDTNWLQVAKELVKLKGEIFNSGCNIQGEIVFQKLQNFWVAKALMSSYIL